MNCGPAIQASYHQGGIERATNNLSAVQNFILKIKIGQSWLKIAPVNNSGNIRQLETTVADSLRA